MKGKIQNPLANGNSEFSVWTLDIMPTIVDLLALPDDSMLDVFDGESILPLFEGKTPQRKHSIPFSREGTALIDGRFKLIRSGRGKVGRWKLFDLKSDPAEAGDISAGRPERFERTKSEAASLDTAVAANAEAKDYPEGRVIQSQRGMPWFEMEEYEQHYATLKRLKPSWNPSQEVT